MKLCELRIRYIAEVKNLIECLTSNGYRVDVAPVWKVFPEKGIERYAVAVFLGDREDGADNG